MLTRGGEVQIFEHLNFDRKLRSGVKKNLKITPFYFRHADMQYFKVETAFDNNIPS